MIIEKVPYKAKHIRDFIFVNFSVYEKAQRVKMEKGSDVRRGS